MIIQDQGLLHEEGAAQGILPGGGVLINSSKTPGDLGFSIPGANVASLAATAMATEILGEPIPNTALLAALLTLTEIVPLEALQAVLAHKFAGDALQRNLTLMREAARNVPAGSWKVRSDA